MPTNSAKNNPSYFAVILTALPVEYGAVRKQLQEATIKEIVHKQGTIYEAGYFEGLHTKWNVVILEIGAGNAGAAFEAERAISIFSPVVVFFVGVAGGIKDVAIGDVVVSTKIYGYESGKSTQALKVRPDVGESTYAIQQRARIESRQIEWLSRVESISPNMAPKVFVAPIAAGEKIVASTKSHVYRFLQRHYGDALAVEMEGRGFLKSVHANRNIEAAVIRGISDLIDEKSQADSSGSQLIASNHAAAFTFQILYKFNPEIYDKKPRNLDQQNSIRYTIIIAGNFNETDISYAKAAFEILKSVSGDTKMCLERVESGSIALVVSGSYTGYERLCLLAASEDIEASHGIVIKDVQIAKASLEDVKRARIKQIRDAEFKRLNFPDIYKKLILAADLILKGLAKKTIIQAYSSEASADDIVQSVVLRYIGSSYAATTKEELLNYLLGLVRSEINKYHKDRKNSKIYLLPNYGEYLENEYSELDFFYHIAESTQESHNYDYDYYEDFRKMLEGDDLALDVFDFLASGANSAKDISRKLMITQKEASNSLKRIRNMLGKWANRREM